MVKSYTERKRLRRSFGVLRDIIPIPALIAMQKSSYESFLQFNVPADKRQNFGLQAVFKSSFPITDNLGLLHLDFVSYKLYEPKRSVEECKQRGLTYSAALRLTLRLVVWDIDPETSVKSIRDIKEQEVYVAEFPLMTEGGTFVVNGTERVVVSQMHRSPGVFFDHDKGRTHSSGKYLFAAHIIPYRGSWLDFEFDTKDFVYFRVDRKKKLLVTTLLMALDPKDVRLKNPFGQEIIPSEDGFTKEDILQYFYDQCLFSYIGDGLWETRFDERLFRVGRRIAHDVFNVKTREILLPAETNITKRLLKKLREDEVESVLLSSDFLCGSFLATDLIDEKDGRVFAEAGNELTLDVIRNLLSVGIHNFSILAIDGISVGAWLRNIVAAEVNETRQEALYDLHRVLNPGDPPNMEAAVAALHQLFFNPSRYDLSVVGRVKLMSRLSLPIEGSLDELNNVLSVDDIFRVVAFLLRLRDGHEEVDDIDHLSNRRVRSVGELLENQCRLGMYRIQRSVKERMASLDIQTLMPHDLLNSRSIASAIREFFTSSQLSQFMDQTNPLSEVTHKRRLSALGPGGLTRERAGFEVRDVHPTHYSRICPIETPEGPNIGLINSLATYAQVNRYGFIEAPYCRVVDGCVSNEIVYLSAMEEGNYVIAQANAARDADGRLLEDLVSCRFRGGYTVVKPQGVQFIDLSPKQVVSIASALIPFLENDDANRALMGANMQRQAVPLMQSDAPLVGTGIEAVVARDANVSVIVKRSGTVLQVDGGRIVIAPEIFDENSSVVDIYHLKKFQRSNQNTCVNQRPLVRVGDRVIEGDLIADGSSVDLGELALGRNVLVAFMPWNGYNFEDSVLISDRLVRDDVFTSIHIEEYEIVARDTKLGQEEITSDIPNISEESLKNLDEYGVIYVGAEVAPGDILVGKVTPKGETPMTPEEKLLRAIFGEKASDVKDTSLRVPPGGSGVVVEVRIFSRQGVEKGERALAIEQAEIANVLKDKQDELNILDKAYIKMLVQMLENQVIMVAPFAPAQEGKPASVEFLESCQFHRFKSLRFMDDNINKKLSSFIDGWKAMREEVEVRCEGKIEGIQSGDDLPPGVIKIVKVFVAVKRKIQPGDKVAGRHGNKGVISKVLPAEDMPYLPDGRPVDVVLNPLGVPSRMNVGQILETHLGWAAAGLGEQVSRALEAYRSGQGVDILCDTLKSVYQDSDVLDDFSGMEEIEEFASNLVKGVPLATPVFDGARDEDITNCLVQAGRDPSGQVYLIDGRTGEYFDRPVTVGYLYVLKLHHLVDDKIHSRSVGPYSLVTQQPLGGKAQFGGQRFGEMEVWALEAYGAAYMLQEFLTIKSDDVPGRIQAYESIVRGKSEFSIGVPESFNVLLKEIRALGLNIELLKDDL